MRKIIFVVLLLVACKSGQNNQAASDLLSAFQTGCSVDGGPLQAALSQTQSLTATIQDLQKNNSCAGVSGALGSIQNLQNQINAVSRDQYAPQVSGLQSLQQQLILQMSQTTDLTTLANLSSLYSSNLLNMVEAQSAMVVAGGGVAQTPLQRGADQLNSYLNQLFSDQSTLLQCGQDNPLLAAQLGAGMLAVAGSFTAPVAGLALSLAGNALSSMLSFIHNSAYSSEIDKLDQVRMATALPCGLEQMTDVYCQAQDLMDIVHMEECGYNTSAPGCPVKTNAASTPFWQGLNILMRELPALQVWTNQVVTGITPSDPYAAKKMNDIADLVSTMDDVDRLAEGVMSDEATKIALLPATNDQFSELRNGLNILLSVLGQDTISTNCQNPFGNCGSNTAIMLTEGTNTKILYDLVGQTPESGCTPSQATGFNGGGSCKSYVDIPLPNPSDATKSWHVIQDNARQMIQNTLAHELALEHQVLNTDPSEILDQVNVPAGEGLPAPAKALEAISIYLQGTQAFFADAAQVPDSLLDGGAVMRAGILGNLRDAQAMVDTVRGTLGNMNGSDDLVPLTSIFNTLKLGKDRNFLFNRLTTLIKLDIHTRIRAGQAPRNIYDILSQAQADPLVGLTQIPPDKVETTLAGLGQAKVTAQLNAKEFGTFFAKSFSKVLQLLKTQADMDGEPLAADPRNAPYRSAQARVCLLLATSQSQWPVEVDSALCKGVSYNSELTGQSLSFDEMYLQLKSGNNPVSRRMCSFYHFYRTSENYAHEKQGEQGPSLWKSLMQFPAMHWLQ